MAKETRPKGYPKLKNYKPSKFMLPTSNYDKQKADRAVRFIENLCHTKGKWAGKRFWLLPWQEQLIRDLREKWGIAAQQEQDREEFYRNNTGIFLHWGVSSECRDTTDPVEVAKIQMKVQKSMERYVKILADAGFVMHMAPKIGIRESRRVRGEYVLTVDDLFGGVQPDDKIADANYPIDAWGWKIPAEIKRKVRPYGIPYRSLIPVGTEGLLLAGRIISGTRLANSSYRVQPICSSVGEAAGTAAAMASLAHTGIRDIDVDKLRSNLDGYGLFDAYK